MTTAPQPRAEGAGEREKLSPDSMAHEAGSCDGLEHWRSALNERRTAYDEYRQSDAFQGQLRRLMRLTQATLQLIWQSWAHSSRWPPLVEQQLMYAGTDDTIESLVGIEALVVQGVHNMARRECRYLLEQGVKHLYVDQKMPDIRSVTRADRERYLVEEVPRSSIEPVGEIEVLLDAGQLKEFRQDVKASWARMAGFVHPSREQLQQRAARAARGAYIGFETTKELTSLVDDLARIYDLVGVLWLTAAGPSAAGDILVGENVEGWSFGRMKWIPRLSRRYDYKTERNFSV